MALVLCGLCATTWGQAPVFAPAAVKEAPVIDGGFEDAAWEEQTWVSNFANPESGEPAAAQTLFRVVHDDSALYLAIFCEDPGEQAPRATLTAHDDTLWVDDCVELMIDPTNRRQTYAHIIVNPNGAVYDAWVTGAGASRDIDYESGAEAAGRLVEEGWQVELRVPFAGLRLSPAAGDTWAFNLCRGKKTAPAELSCWAPPKAVGFHHPESFGTLSPIRANLKEHFIAFATPVFSRPYFEEQDLVGTLDIPYLNGTGHAVRLRVRAAFTRAGGDEMVTEATPTLGEGQGTLKVPVTVGQPGPADLELTIWRTDPDRLVSRGRHEMELGHHPIDITFLRPAYRDTIYASLPCPEIVCNLKVNARPRDLEQCELRVTLNIGATELSVRRARNLSPEGEAIVAFASEIIPAGEYVVKAQALLGDSVLAEGERTLHKLRPQPSEIILDHDGHLLVNGRRFFPSGFMGAAPDPRLQQAGFNTIHTYTAWYTHRDGDLKTWLDEADSMGLKVVLYPYPGEVGFTGFRDRARITDEDLEDILRFVDQYKTHPAVLAWYLCDEPRGAQWRESIRRVYEALVSADPCHPCVALDNSPSTLLKLEGSADILWIDPYPGFQREGGPREPLSMVGRAVQEVREGLRSPRPVWVAPQAFSYAEWDEARKATERAPNLQEIRCMHYLALLSGAEGIIPFAWTYARRHPSTRNTYLESIGPEMAALSHYFLYGARVENCRGETPGKEGDIRVGVWEHEGEMCIVAVNARPEEVRARLRVPGLGRRRVKELGAKRFIETDHDALEETFAPYAVHIYSDERRLPGLLPLEQVLKHIENDEAAQARSQQ